MIPHSRPTLGTEEKKACADVIDSLHLAQGRKVEEFEKAFCAFTGRRHAVAVSSGTAALHLTLVALGVGQKHQVIIPSYNCAAILQPIVALRAKPVFADIDPEDFNISAADTARKIEKNTGAAVIPHLFGRAADMDKFTKLHIPLIEDGTQALGAKAGKKKVGCFGVASIFSFYATKMITTGEGGMVVTDSKKMADRVRDLRDYDKKETFRPRTNSKMTDLEAAMGLVQLAKLSGFIQKRRSIAARYAEVFGNAPVEIPRDASSRDHVYFRYVVRVKGRKALAWVKALNKGGIEAKPPIFKPLHRYLNRADSSFPETAKAMAEAVSLPIFPAMTNEQFDCVRSECLRLLTDAGAKSYVAI
ncbi:MAG: hypothetical protein UV78_C0076G0005 [Parcubacteria group bacterium GW2011_GWA2_43_17]|nr:MAG: hypothetical protein UV78_C0076G0005 [Parcubacteria group bacterium GW2011_GWA2_43_17]